MGFLGSVAHCGRLLRFHRRPRRLLTDRPAARRRRPECARAVLLSRLWFALFAAAGLHHRARAGPQARGSKGGGWVPLTPIARCGRRSPGMAARPQHRAYYCSPAPVFRDGLTGVTTFGACWASTSTASRRRTSCCSAYAQRHRARGACSGGSASMIGSRSRPVIVGSLIAISPSPSRWWRCPGAGVSGVRAAAVIVHRADPSSARTLMLRMSADGKEAWLLASTPRPVAQCRSWRHGCSPRFIVLVPPTAPAWPGYASSSWPALWGCYGASTWAVLGVCA